MESVSGLFCDPVLTLRLSGHVDSGNASGVEQAVTELLTKYRPADVVIDAEALTYISSAGLRIILRLKKDFGDLSLINVTPEVYEILDMTGFTEMMTVQKAYRRLSVEGCEVIGQGANGKVYRLDADTIIKVYLNPDSLPDIHRERELARRAFVLGIPTAIPYDVVRVGEGYGSVFELLNAKSFAKLITASPEKLEEVVSMSVDLAKRIHTTEVKPGDMPDMKATALGWARDLAAVLPGESFEKLCRLIEAVPERHTMLHGDFHFKNIMLQNGEVLLIDMDTLCYGHPVFEFASVFLAYQGFGDLDHGNIEAFLGIPYETAARIWTRTLELYFGTADETVLKAVADKAKLVGYTRLLRRTVRRNPENTPLIQHAKACLTDLISRTDTLTF